MSEDKHNDNDKTIKIIFGILGLVLAYLLANNKVNTKEKITKEIGCCPELLKNQKMIKDSLANTNTNTNTIVTKETIIEKPPYSLLYNLYYIVPLITIFPTYISYAKYLVPYISYAKYLVPYISFAKYLVPVSSNLLIGMRYLMPRILQNFKAAKDILFNPNNVNYINNDNNDNVRREEPTNPPTQRPTQRPTLAPTLAPTDEPKKDVEEILNKDNPSRIVIVSGKEEYLQEGIQRVEKQKSSNKLYTFFKDASDVVVEGTRVVTEKINDVTGFSGNTYNMLKYTLKGGEGHLSGKREKAVENEKDLKEDINEGEENINVVNTDNFNLIEYVKLTEDHIYESLGIDRQQLVNLEYSTGYATLMEIIDIDVKKYFNSILNAIMNGNMYYAMFYIERITNAILFRLAQRRGIMDIDIKKIIDKIIEYFGVNMPNNLYRGSEIFSQIILNDNNLVIYRRYLTEIRKIAVPNNSINNLSPVLVRLGFDGIGANVRFEHNWNNLLIDLNKLENSNDRDTAIRFVENIIKSIKECPIPLDVLNKILDEKSNFRLEYLKMIEDYKYELKKYDTLIKKYIEKQKEHAESKLFNDRINIEEELQNIDSELKDIKISINDDELHIFNQLYKDPKILDSILKYLKN